MDVLLSEFLEHNKAAVGAELSAILDDCSEYEKRVIIDGARSLKQVFREARHLIRRRCQQYKQTSPQLELTIGAVFYRWLVILCTGWLFL